jgi:hypothetical protein
MAGPFGDTFAGSSVVLESHTPTGSNPGTSWVKQADNLITDGAGFCADNSSLGSNQYRLSDNLGFDEMDVQAIFTQVLAVGRRGLRVRLDPGDSNGWEFSYDADNTRWLVSDGTASTTAAEAWPGGNVTIKAEMRTGVGKLYANAVLKVTHSSNLLSGRTYAGLTLLNFSGGTVPSALADDFTALGVAPGAAHRLLRLGVR